MQSRKLVKWLSIAALGILVAFFVMFHDRDTPRESEGEYPEVKPGEKLPNIGFSWVYPGPPPAFEFDGPFPEMPDKMLVYKIVYSDPNQFTEAYVRELAEKYFDMPKDAKMSRSGGSLNLYWLKTDTHLFEFQPNTGFFNIVKLEEAQLKQSRDRKDFPSDEECRRIATEYLKTRGLLERDVYGGRVVDNTSSGVMSVGFGRMIDGYKSWGPGSKIVIDIGPGGEIVSVGKQWLELVPWKMAPIKTPQEAFEEVKQGKAFMGASGGKVTKITLRYDTPAGRQEYVQPVYYFDYTAPERDYYAAVPAIRPEYLKSQEEMWKEIEEEGK